MKKRSSSLASRVLVAVLAGGPLLAATNGGRAAEPGAPVREMVEDAPDPAVALMGLANQGHLDPERAEQLLPLLQGGNYREALRVRGELKDAEGRAALGRFIWQRWLALDRDAAFRSLLEIRDSGGGIELGEAYTALSWLVSGRLYADRVKWCEGIFSGAAADARLRSALLEGMAETWLPDGEATAGDLIRKAEGVPARERMEALVSGFGRCCEGCGLWMRTRDLTKEQAAVVVEAMREVVEWAAAGEDAGAEADKALRESKLPEQLGELAGRLAGPAQALTERPLPVAFREGFARGIGQAAARDLKPGEVLHLPAGEDPAVLTGVWAGYLEVKGGEDQVAAYAAWFKGVELSGLPLKLAARGALRTRREEVDLSEGRLAQILKLPAGPFRTEVVLYAGGC